MYSVYMFDGLILPELIDEGGGNDIGTGDAMTSFSQLPGGGFFDNYGAGDSPQNIRPITRDCVLFGETTDELFENFKALRAKIGKRGRLTVAFDNGQRWWQWARLQRVSTPRTLEARVKVLPCALTFITASQQWYGIIQSGDPWEVGDQTFYLGDGSVSLGMNDYSYDIPVGDTNVEATLTNNGNAFVRNMQIILQADGNLIDFRLVSELGQRILWTNPGITGAFTLVIDTGSKTCYVRRDDVDITLDYVRGFGAAVEVAALAAHGLTTGTSVEISGTELYDGVHHDITVTGAEIFTYPIVESVNNNFTEVSGGTVNPVVDGWSGLTVYDRKNWFMLYPGDNEINIIHSGSGTQPYSIQFRWYDHYK